MKSKALNAFIISTFVTLYLIVSVISTIHVIDFFKLSNPDWLAISLAIAFEIGAAASLASLIALKKMNRSLVWGLFIVLTAVQMMGNTYYAFKNLHDIQNWIDLFGLTDSEPIFQKRIMAIISGAILPLVALGFIKSLVDYIRPTDEEPIIETQAPVNDQITDSVTQGLADVEETLSKEESGYVMGKDELKRIFERVEQLRSEGKLPTPTQEDIENEPTALAFTPYNVEEETNDKYNGSESSDVIETKETISDDLRAMLEKELTPDDLRTYAEKSRIIIKTDEDPNPHLTPGVRT
jgi:hypothetical protein